MGKRKGVNGLESEEQDASSPEVKTEPEPPPTGTVKLGGDTALLEWENG